MIKTDNNYLISFCVPVYKTPINKITKCLDSILNSGLSKDEYEIIVVLDGDNEIIDDINEIVDIYTDIHHTNMKLIIHPKNSGLFEARKSAVHQATGKYICHVDSDDYLEYNCFTEFMNYYVTLSDEYDIIQFNYNVIKSKDKIEHGLTEKHSADEIHTIKASLLKSFTVNKYIPGYIWGKLISRELYNKVFNKLPDVYVNYSEDFLALIFLTSYATSYRQFEDIVMYNYVRDEQSMTSNVDRITLNKFKEMLNIVTVMDITRPTYFNDKDIKSAIIETHRRFMSEIFSVLVLPDALSEEDKPKAIQLFIDTFGEETLNHMNETFKETQRKLKQ